MSTVLYLPGTPILFAPVSYDALLSAVSITNGAGRLSARHDRGSGALPARYAWDCRLETAAAATIGRALSLYWAGATAATGGTTCDGSFSESDQAISSVELLRNLRPMGIVQADTTANPGIFGGSGIVHITRRYIQCGFWNNLGATLSGTNTKFVLTLTPIPDSW